MPLQYHAEWKFGNCPYEISNEAHNEFCQLVNRIVEGEDDPQPVYEAFKHAFGLMHWSSNASWAEGDMLTAMGGVRENAARYIASFYSGLEAAKNLGHDVPTVGQLNSILAKHDVPFSIEPPNLILKEGDIEFAPENASEDALATAFVRGPEIGQGGFGTVYRVSRKTKTGEYYFAMKLLSPSAFIEDKERAKARFVREMQVLHKLQHRGIVPMIEAGLDANQTPYILMPLIEGNDLQRALSGAEPSHVLDVFEEILRALEFAHRKSVVHRDLKPTNILVRASDQQPLILDFGCAYLLDEADENLTTTLIGTPAYVPFEVLQNPRHRDLRQDIYACGVLLYQVLAGSLPSRDDYRSIADLVGCNRGIDDVIRNALAPEGRRTPSAEAMRQQLARVRD